MWWLIPMGLIVVAALLAYLGGLFDHNDLDEEEHWKDG